MGKRKSAADWRAFLGTLARTGNARVAARAAGMDVGTAYDKRIKDEGFAARWEGALAKARAKGPLHRLRRSPSPANAGEELVARATKRGTQMIRAGAGRWCARAEDVFLTELGRTACVRGAAAACGFSTRALYERRKHYPDFAARWRTAEERAKERLPGLLVAATIASLDPEIEAGDLPGVNVDQAIAIVRLKGVGTAAGAAAKAGGRAARYGPREPTIEEVRDEIVGRLAAIRRHEARKGEQP